MKINIFPSHYDKYNSITIDTDDLELCSEFGLDDPKPSLFLDDVITDLIEQN